MKFLRFLVTLILVLVLLLLGAVYAVPFFETPDDSPAAGSADWMARLPDEVPLAQVMLPGTHDSATRYVQFGAFFRCQSLSISGQLEAGFRYLDLRVNDKMQLVHNFAACRTGMLPWDSRLKLSSVLQECALFLAQHPTECVVIAVKMEGGSADIASFQYALDAELRGVASSFLPADALPTVGAARGRIVLMRRYADAAKLGARAGIPLLWDDQGGQPPFARSAPYIDSEKSGYPLRVQDRYEYSIDVKWNAFANTPPGEGLTLNFLSTKGPQFVGHPYLTAYHLNATMLQFGLKYQTEGGTEWIITDFGTPALARRIWQANPALRD